MNQRILLAFLLAVLPAFSQSPRAPATDPYAPLRLYEGKWRLEKSGAQQGESMQVENQCAKTGVFFVCEQLINGKSEDLVIFLPTTAEGTTQKYRTQALSADAKKPTDWNQLEISGDRWTYSREDTEDGVKSYWRTTNLFTGPDKIHFEVQHSSDGKTWETKQSGDEQREK